jgi:hypothetical protein
MKLYQRFSIHKSVFKAYQEGKITKILSLFPYFQQYGVNNFAIEQIEEVEFENKKDLLLVEQLHIEINNCINKINAIITIEEKIERKRIYREQNRELLRLYINRKFNCPSCAKEFSRGNLYAHIKKHHPI